MNEFASSDVTYEEALTNAQELRHLSVALVELVTAGLINRKEARAILERFGWLGDDDSSSSDPPTE